MISSIKNKTSLRHMRALSRQNLGATVVRQQVLGARGSGQGGGLAQHTGGWGGGAYAGGEYGMEPTLGVEKRSQTGCHHRAGGKAG